MSTASSTLSMLARVARSRELRRVELAYAGFSVCEHGAWLAVLVFALEQGGPREVGIVAFVQLVPTVVLTPFSAYAGDRFRSRRALAVGYALQALFAAATAVAMFADQRIAVYATATVLATAVSFTRPIMGTLLPNCTHRPSDLIAANVVVGVSEQFGMFAGPLLAGLALVLWSPGVALAATAVVLLMGFAAVATVDVDDPPPPAPPDGQAVMSQLLAGFGVLGRSARLLALVGLIATAGVVKGIADVAFVTFADDRLGGAGGQAGVLGASYGVGGVVGATLVTRLVRDHRLGRQFVTGALAVAVGLVSLAVLDRFGPALLAFAAAGLGTAVLQLTATVTVQREAPSAVLCRIFGIVEATSTGMLAIGSLVFSVVAVRTSLGEAFVAGAVVVVLLVAVTAVAAERRRGDVVLIDAEMVDRVVADPVFAMLPAPQVERLTRAAEHRSVPAGYVVVRQGDVGDAYYLIVAGEFAVEVDGRRLRVLGPGEGFGEIALLRDVPRTATVTALGSGELLAVGRDQFLEAVTGHPHSLRTAEGIAEGFVGGHG